MTSLQQYALPGPQADGAAGPPHPRAAADAVSVCVVGAGPRGTVMLERLCANAPLLAPGVRIDVHVVDPYPVGGGRVWRSDQSPHVVMNTVASDVTVFTDDTVRCEGPIRPGPSQYAWARMVATGALPAPDARTAAEAATLRPWSYATRGFQGHYLGWAFEHIAGTAPEQIRVHVHRDQAIAIDDLDDGRQQVWLRDAPEPILADAVVLAVGHFDVRPRPAESALADFARRHDLVYVPPGNPAEADLDPIRPGEPVLLRGMGLNFFDYVALFSLGRGGSFERTEGRLRYTPSGAEPLLLAGSGRGVPYTARAEVRLEIVPRYQPRFLTPQVIATLRRRAGSGANDFMRDLWPWICKEVGWVYYGHLLRARGDAPALERFTAAYPECEWGTERMDRLIAELFPDPAVRWDWTAVDKPAHDVRFPSDEAFQAWTLDRLRDDFEHSGLGPAGSARKATAAMMRDLRDEIRQVISHQGISGRSYRDHIDRWFSGLNNYISSGPPASRIEELIALAEAGVVRFVGPRMRVDADDEIGCFVGSSPNVAAPPARARVLVEAHLALTDVRRADDPLLLNLLETGRARPHSIPDPDGGCYETGGLDVTEGSLRVVDAHGRPHPGRFSFGPPIESVQWVTAIGARPHVNSRTLMQGDAIARASLRLGVERVRGGQRSAVAAVG